MILHHQAAPVDPPEEPAYLRVVLHDPHVIPDGLPVPVDDGACGHLEGAALPALVLPSTSGHPVDLSRLERAVLFFYPRTGVPSEPAGPGWNEIPGARGCTPQSVESGGPDTLIRRQAWYVEGGRIAKVWYPVFPPDRNADVVLAWLKEPSGPTA